MNTSLPGRLSDQLIHEAQLTKGSPKDCDWKMNNEGTWNVIFIGHCESRLQTVTKQLKRSWKIFFLIIIRISTFTCIFSLVRQGAVLTCIIRVLTTFFCPLNLPTVQKTFLWELPMTFRSNHMSPTWVCCPPALKDRRLKSSWWLQHTQSHTWGLPGATWWWTRIISYWLSSSSWWPACHRRGPCWCWPCGRHQKEKSPEEWTPAPARSAASTSPRMES